MADAASLPTLDKASLQTVKRVSALRVPKKQCADAMKMMKGCALHKPRDSKRLASCTDTACSKSTSDPLSN